MMFRVSSLRRCVVYVIYAGVFVMLATLLFTHSVTRVSKLPVVPGGTILGLDHESRIFRLSPADRERQHLRPHPASQAIRISIRDVHDYNILISEHRRKVLENVKSEIDTAYNGTVVLRALSELDDTYFRVMGQTRGITAVALYIKEYYPMYDLDDSNIFWTKGGNPRYVGMTFPDDDIYPYGFNKHACTLASGYRYVIKNGTCDLRISPLQTMVPITNDINDVFYQELVEFQRHWNSGFMHAIINATVDTNGYVFHRNLYIMVHNCRKHLKSPLDEKEMPKSWIQNVTYVGEVFVSTHETAGAYYHASVETMSRLGLYLEFLKDNPSIKILVNNTGELTRGTMRMAGISPERLVSGNTSANVVYLPQGPACLQTNTYGLHLVMKEYRNYINNVMRLNKTRDTVILIHRTKGRFLVQHETLKKILSNISNEYGLRFAVFSDLNLPSFHETVELFNRAVMVVGPHGAGFSNIMFSQPRTVVVEILCPNPIGVLCYQHLARSAGHVYYGLSHDRYKYRAVCVKIWVDTDVLDNIVRQYLNGVAPKE